jgi:hypothetical protein
MKKKTVRHEKVLGEDNTPPSPIRVISRQELFVLVVMKTDPTIGFRFGTTEIPLKT